MIVAFGSYSIPLSQDVIRGIVGVNPEFTTLRAESNLLKDKVVFVEVPTKLLAIGNMSLSVNLSKENLVTEKRGKLFSCSFEKKRKGTLGKYHLLSKWTTIRFYSV